MTIFRIVELPRQDDAIPMHDLYRDGEKIYHGFHFGVSSMVESSCKPDDTVIEEYVSSRILARTGERFVADLVSMRELMEGPQ